MLNRLTGWRWADTAHRPIYCWIAIFILAVHSYAAFSQTNNDSHSCQFDQISYTTDFPGARLSACRKTSEDSYELLIHPENLPINDSPWYAFEVESTLPQTVTIILKFEHGTARYQPKIQRDGQRWTVIPHQDGEHTTTFTLTLTKEKVLIAGQELLLLSDTEQWMKEKSQLQSVSLLTVGQSALGRTIQALNISANNKDTIVILGRQHPPEITGAMALQPFVDTLLSNTRLAQSFRQRFRVIVIPIVNPDGVASGHWRHNSNGIDTNRDWGIFSQPETKAIGHLISTLAQLGQHFYLGLDFHSTQQNFLYTQEDNDPLCPQSFTTEWTAAIAAAKPDFQFRRSSRTSDGNPTFKQWFNQTYQVPSISYEMSDDIDRDLLNDVARLAAERMMSALITKTCQ